MVVTSSKEPAWAYPRPSRGRRLHNKRVHPGRSSWWDHQVNPSCHLPFLLPCLPPAISQQPSTTSHQPPTPGHPHTGALLHMGTSSFFLIILLSLVLPYFESRVESSHDTFSRLPGVSSLMSAVWCRQPGVSSLVSAVWCQRSGVSSQVSAVWCQQSGVSGLVSAVWCQRSGASSLESAAWCHPSVVVSVVVIHVQASS
jgi:hypothetical protein